eukprot:gnl/TRDRNA2_/TRDRNA2_130788_c0_seq2.p1 gnl/TRDRNA2_/TRDRNA2_130788_c0~~gnl/TRDRNA2_/TRDRNA2_130788_c0_seq2.p1  ORF type:complete len:158 (+),score=46.53 gnl/TRDRNA2_/TRDRNA2_130788_c0_seq2:43-516(+)
MADQKTIEESKSSAPPIELKAVDHVALQTTDVARLEAFYKRVLGFRSLKRPFDGIFEGAWLAGGGTMIHIMVADAYKKIQDLQASQNVKAPAYQAQPRPAPTRERKPADGRLPVEDHLAFSVHDMRTTRKRLKAFGIECFHIKDAIQEDESQPSSRL